MTALSHKWGENEPTLAYVLLKYVRGRAEHRIVFEREELQRIFGRPFATPFCEAIWIMLDEHGVRRGKEFKIWVSVDGRTWQRKEEPPSASQQGKAQDRSVAAPVPSLSLQLLIEV